MIPGSANPLLLASAAAAPTGYQISRSVRFNAPDSAFLSRTPSVAGDRRQWTWAAWIKRSVLGGTQALFGGGTATPSNNLSSIELDSDRLRFYSYTSGSFVVDTYSQPVYRDAGAWMHLLVRVDTATATPANRIIFYANGSAVARDSSNPSQSADLQINTATTHYLGAYFSGRYFSGYLADIHFIDGQALDPTSFGEFDANGVWQPKAYTGSYPGNSFHLPFSDNSTAAALGTDASGNSNNWTVNNISVAAGSGNDSLVDTPTSYGTDAGAGGEVRGNYCTWNPLAVGSASDLAPSNGNLDVTGFSVAGNRNKSIVSTFGVSSGKWYWEVSVTSVTSTPAVMIGISSKSNPNELGDYPGANAFGWSYYAANGTKNNNATQLSYGASYAAGDTIGVAFDASAGSLTFYKNGASQGVAYSGLAADIYYPAIGHGGSLQSFVTSANFGQRTWAFTPPAGYKALCTTNLPEPQTITTSGSYTGNGLADGPFVYLNGVPTAMTVNGTAVTFGTHADKLSNGFKLRTTSTTYNQNAATYNYSVTSTGPTFKIARAQSN